MNPVTDKIRRDPWNLVSRRSKKMTHPAIRATARYFFKWRLESEVEFLRKIVKAEVETPEQNSDEDQ